jgi:hypothetical protein
MNCRLSTFVIPGKNLTVVSRVKAGIQCAGLPILSAGIGGHNTDLFRCERRVGQPDLS